MATPTAAAQPAIPGRGIERVSFDIKELYTSHRSIDGRKRDLDRVKRPLRVMF